MLELRINGFGGQGSVTLAHLLAQAALENGEQGQALPFFGVERRGAPVRAAVRMSPTTIHAHSQCELPDYVVVMSEKLTQAALGEGIIETGTVIINAPQAVPIENHPTWQVDAEAIARQAGLFNADGPLINIPLFGAVCRVLNIPRNIMEQTIMNKWPGKNGERNLGPAGEAYNTVKQVNA
ncbi:MAG: pyruvate ferredoxin oxidoreductase [Syntrophomonadaceae bacterium]|nr:pyruvate ferredoxin oxidoreductase [Syntrophomonadaceae bacterium]